MNSIFLTFLNGKSLFRSRRGSQDNILHSPARSLGEESGGEDREEDDPNHLRVLSQLERGCGDGATPRKERTTSVDKKTSLRPIQEKRSRERPTEEAGEEGTTSVDKKTSLRPIQEKRSRERPTEEAGEERKGVDLCYNVSVTVNNRYMRRNRIDFFSFHRVFEVFRCDPMICRRKQGDY